jgi:hypothetical protein
VSGFPKGIFTAIKKPAIFVDGIWCACKSSYRMASWKNEDDIKAELRTLTDELKHLREELRSMVSPPKQNPSRAFLHRQTWPSESKPAIAAERGIANRERPERKKSKGKKR